jgi:hypothetical protein
MSVVMASLPVVLLLCLLVAALQVMAAAFGRSVGEVFISLSNTPVAAASLGQVYKGTLRPEFGGGQVAVKVQRPGQCLFFFCCGSMLPLQAPAAAVV